MNVINSRKLLAALLAASISMTGACATTANKSANAAAEKPAPIKGSDCVFFRSLYDWQELDENNLVLWAPGRRDAYQVYMMMPLLDLKFSVQLAFVDKDHDGQLCGFSRDEIVITKSGFPQHSPITAMKRLDAEGIAKLEAQYKVSLSRESKKKKPAEPTAAAAQ